jgi:hypothetical protein
VPFTSFQLTLPQGEYAALGAYVPNSPTGSLCATKLVMPTEIVAQNGMALYQSTQIAVTGCPPSVAITKTSVKTSAIAVTVKLGQAGTVVISGKGIRKKTIHGAKAGTRTITIPLTATGRAARKHNAKLKIVVALTAGGKTGTATSTVRASPLRLQSEEGQGAQGRRPRGVLAETGIRAKRACPPGFGTRAAAKYPALGKDAEIRRSSAL